MLGVKLSEAQSYLVKSSDLVNMVICDGFNHLISSETITSLKGQTNITSTNSSPFPRPPVPTPPIRTTLNHLNESINQNGNNGFHCTSDSSDAVNNIKGLNKNSPTPISTSTDQNSSSICNYDNLRSIDSDDSHLASPDRIKNSTSNNLINNNFSNNERPKMLNSTSLTSSINGKNGANMTSVNDNYNQQQISNLPITDKSLMNNIMNKSLPNDPKSQSMFTTNNNSNNINNVNVNNVSTFLKIIKT